MFKLLLLTNCLVLSTIAGSHDDPDPGFCSTTTRCRIDMSQGPPGPKGDRGRIGERGPRNDAEIESLQRQIMQLTEVNSNLENEVDALRELAFSFPAECSSYIKYETDEIKYEAVPIYPRKSEGDYTPIIANCTGLKVLDGDIDVPFVMDVPKNSITGRTLIIKAIPLMQAPYTPFDPYQGMALNFLGYEGDEEIILLQLTPRWVERSFVRNSFVDGVWKTEERHLDVSFPFRNGVEFTWKITVDQAGYYVEQDGHKLFSFAHRIPLSKLRSFIIKHNVRVTYLSFN